MTITADRSLQSFRHEWLDSVVACCQTFVGTVMLPNESHSIPELASAFIGALPDAQIQAEDLALRALLIDVAFKWGTTLHEHAHSGSHSHCSFAPWQSVVRFVRDARPGAKDRFLEWAHAFSVEFSRWHPVSSARRAATIITERPCQRWNADALAPRLGTSPRQLQREFCQTFGMTLARFVRQARLLRALDMMVERPGKIEPVALEVGYRSKKNFYQAFKQSVGMTPTAFLQLPAHEARRILDDARVARA